MKPDIRKARNEKKQWDYLRRMFREQRDKRGLSQAQLAKLLGKHQTFVSKYERGDTKLNVLEFIEVSTTLKLPPSFVIDELTNL